MVKQENYTFSVHPERDADIIEIIESIPKSQRSEFIRQAIRYYAGLITENDGDIDKALYRVIQLEKRLAELEKRSEERYQSILELIQNELEESRKERAELKRELSILKQSIEKAQQKVKEEQQKKEEEERKRREEATKLMKAQFEWYADCAKYGGLTIEQRIKLKKDIEAFARAHGLTVEEVKTTLLSIYPILNNYLNGKGVVGYV